MAEQKEPSLAKTLVYGAFGHDPNAPNQQPSLGAELKAMGREALKDIREALVDRGWFGQGGGPGEPGTPLNPTPQMVTQDLGTVYGGYHEQLDAYGQQPSYQDMLREAAERAGPEQEQDRGLAL
jgi:hypothetical protein